MFGAVRSGSERVWFRVVRSVRSVRSGSDPSARARARRARIARNSRSCSPEPLLLSSSPRAVPKGTQANLRRENKTETQTVSQGPATSRTQRHEHTSATALASCGRADKRLVSARGRSRRAERGRSGCEVSKTRGDPTERLDEMGRCARNRGRARVQTRVRARARRARRTSNVTGARSARRRLDCQRSLGCTRGVVRHMFSYEP